MWTDESPKDDGFYWLRSRGSKPRDTVARKCDESWYVEGFDEWEVTHLAAAYQFGHRIPSPEELDAERRTMSEALDLIIELRRELAEVKKGGGLCTE